MAYDDDPKKSEIPIIDDVVCCRLKDEIRCSIYVW